MTPSVVHRFSFCITDAIEALIGDAAAGCEAMELRIVGDLVVIDVVGPAGRAAVAEPPPLAPEPEATPEEPKAARRKGGALAQRAGIICAERGFWTFASRRYSADIQSAEGAATWLRGVCNRITSRADLDHDEHAAAVFREISKAYALWLEGYE